MIRIFATITFLKNFIMKKILMIFAAMAISFMAAAQTVESSKLFENTYVTVFGGGTTTGAFNQVPTPFFWDGAKGVVEGVRPYAGVEFGKYVTPVVGFSVEGLGFFGTTNSKTFFDESAVLANGKLNFSNWFGGYKGQPRRVEVVGVLGMGWGHDYVGNGQTWTSYPNEELEPVVGTNVYNDQVVYTDKDYVVYNAGAELNVNLGKARAWQINVRPGVMWFNKHTKTQYQSLPRFMNDARANLQVGVTYKFGSKSKKSHNFVLCPYSVTKADYDAALARIAELESRGPQVKEVEVIKEVEKVVKDTVEVEVANGAVVYFTIGNYELSSREFARLDFFAKGIEHPAQAKVKVTGSADTKTGSKARNEFLAQKRAEAVKKVLVNVYGFKDENVEIDTILDVFDRPENTRVAIVE